MKSEREIELMKRELELEKFGVETAIEEICGKRQINDYNFDNSERWTILKVQIDVLNYVLNDNIEL